MKYCIVDIETTGLDASSDRITELTAIRLYDGRKHDEIHVKFNPGKEIPRHVSILTGISQESTEGAPFFEEEALRVFQFMDDHIIVAHQAHFDVHFLKASFKRSGIHFQPKSLCTLRLSRKLLPNLRGFTLAHVCHYMGIKNAQAHRAWGDAHATVQIFLGLLGLGALPLIKKEIERRTSPENIPVNVDRIEWDAMPEETGVYYLLDRQKRIIYIGKAANIRQRVSQHFKGASKRAVALRNEVYAIQWKVTGSYMVATLLEDVEIPKFWPVWNVAQKHASVWYGVVQYTDRRGMDRLRAGRVHNPQIALVRFANQWQCRDWLWQVVRDYGLDPHLCGLPSEKHVAPAKHQKGMQKLANHLALSHAGIACIAKGPDPTKESVLLFEKDVIRFGFVPVGMRHFSQHDVGEFTTVNVQRAAVKSLIAPYLMGRIEPFEKIDWKMEKASEN